MLAFIESSPRATTRRRAWTMAPAKADARTLTQAAQTTLACHRRQASGTLRFAGVVLDSSWECCRRIFVCHARPSQWIETQSASMTTGIETNLDSIAVAGPP